jgi:hypothetical protein
MITFANRAASTIKVGDLMRQAEEGKRQTDFYHFQATSVTRGDIAIPIHDGNGVYLGDRIEKDTVLIDWSPIEQGRAFTQRYHPNATIEIATQPVDDHSQLLTQEEHAEEE